MKLTSIMRKSLVFPDLTAKTKIDLISQMVAGISKEYPILPEAELMAAIMERERLSSTGIGSGIAIPHAKLPQAKEHIAAFGRSKMGIQFEAIDSKPVHLVFMIIGPVGANEAHLKALARISKFLHDTAFRERLFTAETPSLIYEAIAEKDAQY